MKNLANNAETQLNSSIPGCITSMITNHIGIKAACLFLAVFLWLYVTSETTMRKNFHVPIRVEARSQMVIGSISNGSVFIGVEGERKAILKATPGDFSLIIDLSRESRRGTYTRAILPDDIKSPSGINITNVSPTNIVIVLRKGSREGTK